MAGLLQRRGPAQDRIVKLATQRHAGIRTTSAQAPGAASSGSGMPCPRGVRPRPPLRDRLVMRMPDPVRVFGSFSPTQRTEGCLARVLGKATAQTISVQNSAQQETA
jgi:hypothetical protein